MSLTFDLHILIRSSLSQVNVCARCNENPNECYWYISQEHKAPVTLTFHLWPINSNNFTLKSKWTFVPNLKKFPWDIVKISRSQQWDGRTGGQQENIMPTSTGCHQLWKIWKKDFLSTVWVKSEAQRLKNTQTQMKMSVGLSDRSRSLYFPLSSQTSAPDWVLTVQVSSQTTDTDSVDPHWSDS